MREGRLAENVAYFGRALRAAGMAVGPGDVLDAVQALEVAGIGPKEDVYWTLHAVFVRRHEDHEVFDQAFRIFWRRRGATERLIAMLSPPAPPRPGSAAPAPLRRVEEALFGGIGQRREVEAPEIAFDARLTASDDDVLRTRDFAQMSAAEIAEARRRIARLVLPDDAAPTRRFRPAPAGARFDMRATVRAGLSSGGQLLLPQFRTPRHRPPPVVALVDISGSMADYSRAILHFLHALAEQRRVHTFLFGTRLTNVTRALRRRDPDAALSAVAGAVPDWSGGTRIAASLRAFNKDWSRRVLGQSPVVLLVTDGLERDADETLELEIDRLHRSCRRLVWLNPLLRFSRFEPKARGIRALLPHVDEFRPVHDLASLEALVAALSSEAPRGRPWKWAS
ncbi:MAG: VWA domain-containing protein [Rhizobiales bacterium 17-65-6]|nr:MAG: VWA domain-containing protein [Rhizobiales bacterium 12-68-15]OYZ90086.1 MAG: VWA domain-containing protein [Rhizobiales bacterium 17-65-6]